MTQELDDALRSLRGPRRDHSASITSDLTIDESLLLHQAGFEPTDLVTGTSVQSIPYGTFGVFLGQNGAGEIPAATGAVQDAFRVATERIGRDGARSGGIGIVGVEVEIDIRGLSVTVVLTGTAVRPIEMREAPPGRPFTTDMSVQDFVLLRRAGWEPVDLAYGSSFVAAPMRRVGQMISQSTQNVELTNLTQAFSDARENAMERMQRAASSAGATGVVDVSILDGALGAARHVFSFICYGTAVRLGAEVHQRIEPELVLPLDDPQSVFEATALRG